MEGKVKYETFELIAPLSLAGEESEAKHAHDKRGRLIKCHDPVEFVQLSDELTELHEDMMIDVARKVGELTGSAPVSLMRLQLY